jgi:hypothetical protein
MNTEKLNALAAQAGFDVERLRAPYPGGFPREDMLALESFAELIVKECLQMADEFEIDVNRSGLVSRMEYHFGVDNK